jgi:hypothetical protein
MIGRSSRTAAYAPIADMTVAVHPRRMKARYRHAELLSPDSRLRLAIYDRADHRYLIVEERVRSYETGDEWHPDFVPFPCNANWQPFWQIDSQPREGVFGTIDDALNEARHLLANGG